MKGARLLFWTAVAVAGWSLLGCGDNTQSVAMPGTAVVSLSSTATDRAILLRVTGPGFTGAPLAAGSSTKLYWRQVSENEIAVALFGTIGAGALFQIEIPGAGAAARYAGTVLDVADRLDDERTEPGGYAVGVVVAR